MTAYVELLPLEPQEAGAKFNFTRQETRAIARDYARANVAHATAAKDAEIEALRAEVEDLGEQLVDAAALANDLRSYEHIAKIEKARAERLAEALRDVMPFVVTDVLEHCDGNKCREQWCAGCSGDDEASEAVARSAKAAGVAYALLHPTAAQEDKNDGND